VPTAFVTPTLFADESIIEEYKDFESFVNAIQAGADAPVYREYDPSWTPEEQNAYYEDVYGQKDFEDQPVITLASLSEAFDAFYASSAPAIFSESSGINKENLTAFLQNIKTVSDKLKLTDPENANFSVGGNSMSSGYANFRMSGSLQAFSEHRMRSGVNMLGSTEILLMLAQNLHWTVQVYPEPTITIDPETGMEVHEEPQEEDVREVSDVVPAYSAAPGLASGVYIPVQMVGVTSVSKQQGYAKDFVNAMLSEFTQTHDMGNGFPVTQSGVKSVNELYAARASEDYLVQEGVKSIDFDLGNLVSGLQTPYVENAFVKDIILQNATAFCTQNMPIETVVGKIVSETEMYFAERQ
jgi:hypothetical protein